MVSEFRFFQKKMKKKNMANLENHVYLYFGSHMIFSSIFGMLLLFHMFSTLMSLEVMKLKVKTEISLCMAIMQNNPLPSQY